MKPRPSQTFHEKGTESGESFQKDACFAEGCSLGNFALLFIQVFLFMKDFFLSFANLIAPSINGH